MSVISNECVVFSIGENINPNDEIFNFTNFVKILNLSSEDSKLYQFLNTEYELDREKLGTTLRDLLLKCEESTIQLLKKQWKILQI